MGQDLTETQAQQTDTLAAIRAALPNFTGLFVAGRAILLTLPGKPMPGDTTLAPDRVDLQAIEATCRALQATRAEQDAQQARGAA